MILRAMLVTMVGLAVQVACSAAHAAEVTPSEAAYCHQYAEFEYQQAVDRDDELPDAFYEGAREECEFQWRMLAAQWDDPENLDRVAQLALLAARS